MFGCKRAARSAKDLGMFRCGLCVGQDTRQAIGFLVLCHPGFPTQLGLGVEIQSNSVKFTTSRTNKHAFVVDLDNIDVCFVR